MATKLKNTPGLWQPVFAHSGFHGDPKLLKLVDSLVPSVTTFIETGTEAGSTLAYMSRLYPWLTLLSCEAHPQIAKMAERNLQNHELGSRVRIHNGKSLDFLEMLANQFKLNQEPTLFWLDAHSHGFGCPVREEVNYILANWKSGWILIDDFEVPHNSKFGFDTYEDGKLGVDRIAGIPRPIYLPDYDPPFGARGWCLIPIENGGCPQFVISMR